MNGTKKDGKHPSLSLSLFQKPSVLLLFFARNSDVAARAIRAIYCDKALFVWVFWRRRRCGPLVVEIKIKAGGGETDNQKLHHDTLGGRRTESDARGMLEFGILRDAEIKRRSSILSPSLVPNWPLSTAIWRRFRRGGGGGGRPPGQRDDAFATIFFFLSLQRTVGVKR